MATNAMDDISTPTISPILNNTNPAPTIISVEDLTRRFKDFTAVNRVSFQVYEKEIFGFLGPNGAGKSTTIKMLCTLLKPSGGKASVAGFDVVTQADAVRSNIGIVFQDTSLDSGLTAMENLQFHCMMYHIPKDERAQRMSDVLELMELTEHKDRIVKTYSGGMRRRLEIARGLLHEPRLMFLDEPTVGLDPQTRNYIWQYVRQLRERHNTTIFMTTHYMEEAENCDRIAIIDHGVIVALDTPNALKKLVGEDQVTLATQDNPQAAQMIEAVYGFPVNVKDGHVVFQVSEADRFVPRLLAELPRHSADLVIESLQIRRPSLEDVFLKLTGRTIRDEEGGKDERRLAMIKRGRI